MDKVVGSFTWEGCETCKHGPDTGGCDIPDPDWVDFAPDASWDFIVCTRYEAKDEDES